MPVDNSVDEIKRIKVILAQTLAEFFPIAFGSDFGWDIKVRKFLISIQTVKIGF